MLSQYDGKTRELLAKGRQLVINYQAQIDACPDDVYYATTTIPQDGNAQVEAPTVVDPNEQHLGVGLA